MRQGCEHGVVFPKELCPWCLKAKNERLRAALEQFSNESNWYRFEFEVHTTFTDSIEKGIQWLGNGDPLKLATDALSLSADRFDAPLPENDDADSDE